MYKLLNFIVHVYDWTGLNIKNKERLTYTLSIQWIDNGCIHFKSLISDVLPEENKIDKSPNWWRVTISLTIVTLNYY